LVSPDFRDHSCAYFLEALWRHRDASEIQLFAYSEFPFEDARTRQFQARSDGWRSTHGRSDQEVAGMVRSDAIDILVDLAGHTLGNRLGVFSLRPAPIQVTWLGYPATTGLRVFDGRITDALADPPGSEAHATEPLLRLPRFLCYTPAAETPSPHPPPSSLGNPPTFGCFNALAKLNDQVFELWSRLLGRHPSARLLLKTKSLQHRSAQEHFLRAFTERGVAQDRIEFLGWLPDGPSHLAAYHRVDVALDPFPYNGTTTTCEALWMGVPVVTLRGDRHSGRVGDSLLHAAGLQEWVAASEDDYLRIALGLISNPAGLAACRRGLRARLEASPLLDGPAFTRTVQDLFRRVWAQAI
jgi:predicted O-linked N-acetylglucosamine transferase (SPINDLY family)